jgi:hypothetical protein
MSQNSAILKYLRAGHSLTPLDALRRFGCLRLSGRIKNLRDAGHRILTQMVSVGGKRVARYRMVLG